MFRSHEFPVTPRPVRRGVSTWIGRLVGATLVTVGLLGTFATAAIAEPSAVYEVRPGDTLSGIAQARGLSTTALARMNHLSNPNLIEVGQVLRLGASGTAPATAPALSMRPLQKATSGPLRAPYFNQFDGSVWGSSNCGPTSLAMALGAVGISAQPLQLRALANQEMRSWSPSNGTTWEALAYAAHQHGALTGGLYRGSYYRTWTIDDLKGAVNAGHPVLLLVRYRSLPDHATSAYQGDHYIVALGFDAAGNLIYSDPATVNGADRIITQTQLLNAWSRTRVGLVRTAMIVER